LRAERVSQPDESLITVRRLELTAAEQHLLRRRAALLNRQLVVDQAHEAEEVERQALVQAEVSIPEDLQVVLLEIVQVMTPLERQTGRAPRLFDVERHGQALARERLAEPVED